MKKAKLIIGFNRFRNKELLTKAQFILDSMTGHGNFETFASDLAALKENVLSYATALSKAESRSKADIAAMNQARKALEEQLRDIALRVESHAKGDEVVLLSSGFSLAKNNMPIGILPKPENFTLEPHNKGTIDLSLDSIRGANSYQYEYKMVGAEAWTVKVGTKSKLTLKGLSSGAEYEFRVAGIGAAEDRVYSDIIKSFIL